MKSTIDCHVTTIHFLEKENRALKEENAILKSELDAAEEFLRERQGLINQFECPILRKE